MRFSKEELVELKSVREKLKECKPEWLEKNAKGQDSLGVGTVQQILDYATDGVTIWDFEVTEQWREEVNKFQKQSGQWQFDGYVYHVLGRLHIEGIGSRSQYGSKVAIGGKDNQNSSYKSAASDCLKKCASLFGVGSSIYSRIKIETEEVEHTQNNQQYQQQEQQQVQPQQITHPDGVIQQGEWCWVNNNWMHESEYLALKQQQNVQQQDGRYPTGTQPLTPEQEKTQWYHDTMQEFDPNGYQQMRQFSGPSPVEQQQATIQEAMSHADLHVHNPNVDYPFENVPKNNEIKQVEAQQFEATPQSEASPQAEVQQQEYQAIQYGAPTETKEAPTPDVAPPERKEDPLANVVAQNPWDTPQNVEQIEIFRQHKERLNIQTDSQLLPHVREFFKDENAGMDNITPEILQGFNTHLQNVQA
jgi:hypothetical protein